MANGTTGLVHYTRYYKALNVYITLFVISRKKQTKNNLVCEVLSCKNKLNVHKTSQNIWPAKHKDFTVFSGQTTDGERTNSQVTNYTFTNPTKSTQEQT